MRKRNERAKQCNISRNRVTCYPRRAEAGWPRESPLALSEPIQTLRKRARLWLMNGREVSVMPYGRTCRNVKPGSCWKSAL